MYVVPPPARVLPASPARQSASPDAPSRVVRSPTTAPRVVPARRAARPVGRPRPVVAAQKVPRGFALYVGLDEPATADGGTDLRQVVERLRRHLAEIIPGSESSASVVVAPQGSGGRGLDVVRTVTGATTGAVGGGRSIPLRRPHRGVVVDLARGRVLVEGENVGVTTTELALLRLLVLHPGTDVARAEVVAALWGGQDGRLPSPRVVDVHVRRLRAKLGEYDDVVRTVRGSGYRFDPHPDVVVRHASAPPSAALTGRGPARVPDEVVDRAGSAGPASQLHALRTRAGA